MWSIDICRGKLHLKYIFITLNRLAQNITKYLGQRKLKVKTKKYYLFMFYDDWN